MQQPPEATDESRRLAEVLRLAFIDGLGVRAISRRLSMSRKTVRRILNREEDDQERQGRGHRIP